ncbi:hypothetical protein MKW94_028388 [Papaver nudicaule]|uniref:Thioredoxin domain-containing protein n=1 Tax=Papaver nudicaule TaxID=74823 RepID=A0AA41V4V5_PAPNU|nr:hypothetical protein [Papaver nudicaule]
MAAILTMATASCAITTSTTTTKTLAFHALQKPPLSFQNSSPKTLPCNLFSSSSNLNKPNNLTNLSSLSTTTTRKLLCKPPNGKHVREDYLVKKYSEEEIQELVRGDRSVPVILDFYATWCGPCILMAQELEMLAVDYEKDALFIKVDTDDEHEFARDMQVRGLPTLLFISPDPSKDAIRTEGLIPKQMIRDIINNEM